MHDLTRPVLTKAGEIRRALHDAGRHNITPPDSHFVATALLYGADALHTFDDTLLRLSRDPLIERLTICKPRAEQTILGI